MATTTNRLAPVTNPSRDDQPNPIVEVAALLWSALAGIATLTWFTLAGTTKAITWILRKTTVGEYRHAAAPIWVLLAAIGSAWAGNPTIGWYWLVVAVAVKLTMIREPKGRKRVSMRERDLIACTLAVIALVLDAAGYYRPDWRVTWALLAVVALAGGCPWWKWRIGSTGLTKEQRRWAEEVVAHDDRFTGTWQEYDRANKSGIYESHTLKATDLAKLDEQAEWLMKEPAGTVTIAAVPHLNRRCVRIAFAKPGDAGRTRFWEGPTLQSTGKFTALYAQGALALAGRLYMPDGSSHIAIVAPTGSGKGSIQRLIGLEAGLSPDFFVVGVDGKRGKGLGYLRAGFDVYAQTPVEWLVAVTAVVAEMDRRAEDGDLADSFVLRPGRPRILLMIDDLPEVLAAHPRIAGMLQRIAAQGRSLGIGLCIAMQKGDGPSYGSTGTRSNILDGGWMWAGPATDGQAKITMLQSFPFDPTSLPAEKGWAAVMGKHLGDQVVMPGRTLWIPNRNDVREFGMEAPFGTVEDWLERDVIHPEISDDTARLFGLMEDEPEEVVEPAVQVEVPSVTVPAPRPPAPEVLPPEPDARPGQKDGWARVLDALAGAGADGLPRGQVAEQAKITPRHASELLRAGSARGEVVQNSSSNWRLAS